MSYSRKVVQRLPGGHQRVFFQQMGDDTSDGTSTTPTTTAAQDIAAQEAAQVYTTNTQCAAIPAGSPYRVPGNYCTGPNGVWATFDANGNAVSEAPGGVAVPASLVASVAGQSGFLGILTSPLGLAAMLGGYLIMTNKGATKKSSKKR